MGERGDKGGHSEKKATASVLKGAELDYGVAVHKKIRADKLSGRDDYEPTIIESPQRPKSGMKKEDAEYWREQETNHFTKIRNELLRRGAGPTDVRLALLDTAEEFVAANQVIPIALIRAMSEKDGFRNEVLKAVRSNFEADVEDVNSEKNSFGKCNTFKDIFKRLNTIFDNNKNFDSITDFVIPLISLVDERGRTLLGLTKVDKDGKQVSQSSLISMIEEVQAMKAEGKSLDVIRSSPMYRFLTSKYGLRAAVKRALFQP